VLAMAILRLLRQGKDMKIHYLCIERNKRFDPIYIKYIQNEMEV
jgi:hypothetical protein